MTILLGAIAGDMIGKPYEHHVHKSTQFELFSARSRFSDDSVLTVAVADAILQDQEHDPAPGSAERSGSSHSYAEAIRDWGRRYPMAGYGKFFINWLEQDQAAPYNSFGNGSAMRVSAVGWAFSSLEETMIEAERSASVTHNHTEGIKGAQAVALAIFLARNAADKQQIRSEIERLFGYDLQRTVESIRPGYTWDVTCSGSVPESIIAFLDAADFEEAVRNAVSLGGDADTMAAIAGSIAEAFFGGVPARVASQVWDRLPEDMAAVIRRFDKKFGTGS